MKASRAARNPAIEPAANRLAAPGTEPAEAAPVGSARRAIGGGAPALGLGAAGEALLFVEALRPLGAVLLAAAMAGAGWAWWARHRRPEPAAPRARPPDAWPLPIAWRGAGIVSALALAAAALVAYRADPRALFGLQGILWLGAMGLLLLACARWYPRGTPDAGAGPPWTRREGAVFLGLLGLALITHLAFLDAIPWRFHFDEGYAFTETLRYFQGPALSLFSTTWHDTSLPSLWFAFAGGLMRLTGPGLAGTRLGVALIGACLVIPVYGLGRLLAGRLAAALAAFGVAVSAVAVHYSRVSIPNMTTAFAWAVCFYFLLRGLRSRRPGDFVWAGLAGGLSMYTYYGTRLLPVLLFAFAAYLAITQRPLLRAQLGLLALVPAGFLIGFGPLLGYFSLFPEMWTSRTGQFLDVPAAIPTSLAGWAQDWNTLAPLAVRDFLALSVIPGQDTVYYAPLLLPPEAVLVLLGVGVLVAWWRRPEAALLLLTAGGVLATGGLLIDASTIPSFAHWAPALPVFYLAAALPIACLARALARSGALVRRAASGALVLLLLADGGANAYAYLVAYPPLVPPDHSLEALQGRFIQSLPAGSRVRVVGPTWQGYNVEVGGMMGPDKPGGDLLNPSRELPLPGDPSRGIGFAFYDDQETAVSAIQAIYPGGRIIPLQTSDGTHVATGYVVPAAPAWAQHGALLRITAAGRTLWSGTVPVVGTTPAGLSLSYPYDAAWSGAVYLPVAGPAALEMYGLAGARVWVEGQAVTPATILSLDAGWTRFQVEAHLTGARSGQFAIRQGSDPFRAVDTAALWAVAPDQGLATTVVAGSLTHRIDPFVAARYWLLNGTGDPQEIPLIAAPGDQPRIRWEGELRTGAGAYGFTLRTNAPVQLSVDGRRVAGRCQAVAPATPEPEVSGNADLTAGWHHVRLDLQAVPQGDGVEWLWTPPGGTEATVPPDVLRTGGGTAPGAVPPWPAVPPPLACP